MRAEVVALYCASFHSSSDEYPSIFTSYSGQQQRHSEDFQGLSRNGECRRYLVLTDLLSIPPRKTLRMYNTPCSSSWSALVINLHTFLFLDVDAPEGIRALEFYDPVAKKHGQAHMQARLGITQWLIKEGIARVEEIRAADGTLEDLYIRVGPLEFVCIRIHNSLCNRSSTGTRS